MSYIYFSYIKLNTKFLIIIRNKNFKIKNFLQTIFMKYVSEKEK